MCVATLAWAITAAANAGTSLEDDPALATTTVARDLALPVSATHAPHDYTRLFVVEKRGRIRVVNLRTGELAAAPFLDIDPLVGGGTNVNSEQGLLGLAFDPGYRLNGRFFVFHTDNGGHTVIARYERGADADTADPDSRELVIDVTQPAANHNGGWLGFSPADGYLYASFGDGGGGNNPSNSAQDTTNLLGTILRLDVAGDGYAIPPDNPFVDADGADEIWAYGLRNPWRCGFDRQTGDLFIADVGQGSREEVNWEPVTSFGGTNYGWRCREGDWCTSLTGCTCSSNELTDPVHTYRHDAPPAPALFVCSVSGGVPYRGCSIPEIDGRYFYADFCGGAIWSFRVDPDARAAVDHVDHTAALSTSLEDLAVDQVVAFGEDARGEMYIVDQGWGTDGAIHRIIAPDREAAEYDLDCSGEIDVADLVQVILAWGGCDGCLADVDGSGVVDIDDLFVLIEHWG